MISNRSARNLLFERNGLTRKPEGATRRERLSRVIHDLGYVQIDSVNVLERAHHHILHSRDHGYQRRDLHHLVEKDGTLFENWTHDASVIPSSFFPYWRHRFERERSRLRERWKGHFARDGFDDDLVRVRTHVEANGPTMARDFDGDRPSTGWWDWHPSKAALEYLWRTGELAIAARDGFQKVYDLTERVLPEICRTHPVEHHTFVDWACREALRRLGFATRGEIAAFWALLTPAEVGAWIERNRADLTSVEVETRVGRPRTCFGFPGIVEEADATPDPVDRVRILSPFDPLLRDRARAERVFGFHYRIEIFVPEAKRRYGYYVYPVMRGASAVGRIDIKADRDRDALVVRAFWPEQGVRRSNILVSKLEAEFERLRRFAGVSKVEICNGWLAADGDLGEAARDQSE